MVAFFGVVFSSLFVSSAAAFACDFFDSYMKVCSDGGNGSSHPDVSLSGSTFGSDASSDVAPEHEPGPVNVGDLDSPLAAQEDNCDFRCTDWTVNAPPDDAVRPAGGVVVDLNDIARFRPTVGVDRMEPNGWMVIDLPANFYSRGGVVVKAGELLDRDALVRFTPVRWHWDYGDGSQLTSDSPGASWKTLGVDEFEPTGTSQVFDHAGTFEIQLTIFYAAEYQFDGNGWTPIAGVLPVPSNVIEARAVTAKTVLVAEDCTDNPTGPGC
jgi:hypothetical protein